MRTKEEVLRFALSLGDAYQDAPFDGNWQLVRLRKNRRTFVFVYDREGTVWINVKCRPEMAGFWREGFDGVMPAYHMNKKHWNTVILDGSVPEDAVKQMIEDSFELVDR
ncbi:MAG: MmcQ/YjbR family DNA-binding protein [Abditibacteriota bacterium]|nr:MmcQ/YjbR family DNA-binding protein [Abditibacteriota bacterium]